MDPDPAFQVNSDLVPVLNPVSGSRVLKKLKKTAENIFISF
jgi:hypothetical protein